MGLMPGLPMVRLCRPGFQASQVSNPWRWLQRCQWGARARVKDGALVLALAWEWERVQGQQTRARMAGEGQLRD